MRKRKEERERNVKVTRGEKKDFMSQRKKKKKQDEKLRNKKKYNKNRQKKIEIEINLTIERIQRCTHARVKRVK